MAQREKGGRVVFIGNIPYGVSEAEIMQVFGDCGPVMGFRLVYDKETGQPKGFGFLEYADVDSAANAVRNLNNHQLHGRTLRVDYSNENRGTSNNQQDDSKRAVSSAHLNMNGPGAARPDPAALPLLPPGVELPPGVTAFDAISQTISKIDTPQLLDFISQLKNLCASNPAQANALLTQAPQLGYAVFQAMLLMGLVDTNIVTQLVQTAGPPQQAQAPPQPAPLAHPPQPMPYPPQPPQGYPPGYAPSAPPPLGYPPQPTHYAPTPPALQPAYQPPQAAAPPPMAQPPNPQQASALAQQVMQLTMEQIMSLPEEARIQVLQLRQQFGGLV